MLRAFYSSATGMRAQELMLDVTANNIANVNTNGFKRSNIDFADLLYATHRQAGSETATGLASPIGLQVGSGVRAVGTTKNFTVGSIKQTGRPLDVAIEGDGFFKLSVNGETYYTRDGAFHLDANGTLVTGDGAIVDGSVNVPDNVSPNNLSIGENGAVSAVINGAKTDLGTINVVRFRNPAGLSSEGGNRYRLTPASGAELTGVAGSSGFGALRGGMLEQSNVEVVTELVSLITAQRAYEVNSRAIRAGDEMLSNTNDIVR
ncbi:MAG: flagellar basal-body rod protein FlgG [Planctomycetales bacterium]|nr:flagellar basal-body rod protein FlgG [Planctomycetales bacterium]